MRMMMKVTIPVETGNAAARKGDLGKTIQGDFGGHEARSGLLRRRRRQTDRVHFLQMNDSSELPKFAEPWFLAFNASLTVRPAMNLQDLANAAAGIKAAVEAFGKGA